MLSLSNRLIWLLACFSPIAASAAGAADPFNYHGFLSYSYVDTGEVRYLSKEPDSESHLLEGGLAGSYWFNDQLRASLQVIYRDFGDRYDAGIHLDYALLDWNLYGDLDTQLTTQLGRFKNVRGLYNATRDVPFTRPSILLPQGSYLDAFRDPLVSTDGLRLSASQRLDSGQYSLDLGAGKTQAPDDLDNNLLGAMASGSFSNDYHYYLDLRYEPNEQWLLAGNYSDRRFAFSPDPQSPLRELEFDYRALVLSAQYSREFWELVSEYSRSWTTFTPADPNLPTIKAMPESWYLQLRLFLPHDWVALLRYDRYDADQVYGPPSQSGTLPVERAPRYTQTKDYAAGLTWNITPDWMLRMEYHYMDGFAIIPPLALANYDETADRWHIFAAQVAYRF